MEVLQQILEDKKKIIETELLVLSNTKEAFGKIKGKLIGIVNDAESEDVSIVSNTESILEVKLFEKVIGIAIVDGTALINDDKILKYDNDYVQIGKMQDYRQLILSDKFGKYFTGMIVMYVKINNTSNIVISRFYVNKNKEVLYRSELGWSDFQWFNEETLLDSVSDYILSSISNGLFEIKIHWNHEHQEFSHLSELSSESRIGFL